MGSSVKLKGRGIIISTSDYNIPYTVKLMNVLIIKYSLHCNLLLSNNNTRIYIYRSSLKYLITIIKSVLISSVSNITNERLGYFNSFLDEMSNDNYVASSKFDPIISKKPFSYNLNKVRANHFNFLKLPQRRTISSSFTVLGDIK